MKYKSYAKVNIGLNVLYKRHDNYHELESIMTSVDLYDELTFEKTTDSTIELTCNLDYIAPKKNIVYTIAYDLQKKYNIESGLKIHIEKKIPVAGGMAGGSTNAATTIKALNEIWDLNLTLKEMMKIGETYGADIPFCINVTPAVVTGIGEHVKPFTFKSNFNIIVVKMPFGLSTKEVFNHLDFDNISFYSIDKIKDALINQNNQALKASLGNNLESVSLKLKPEIKNVKEFLIQNGCFTALMSGSGPTVLGFIEKNINTQDIITNLEAKGYEVYLTKVIEEEK